MPSATTGTAYLDNLHVEGVQDSCEEGSI